MSVLEPPGLPPDDFDPDNNPNDCARLEEFQLPSQPDPEREPALYEHWREMFSGPLRFVRALQPLEASSAALLAPAPAFASSAPNALPLLTRSAVTRSELSRNWSGAYVLPNHGCRFTRVVGRWTVPKVRPGTGPNPESLPFRCSVWIGLDGKKGWASSMPQVGTVHTVAADGTAAPPRLWWQWWVRDGNSEPHDIPGVPLQVGDVVLCSLTVVSPHEVRFHVKNRNTGTFAGLTVHEKVPMRGSSAEWVVERPADLRRVDGRPETGPLFPLPDFGSVLFERCATQAASEPGAGGAYRPLQAARLIRMGQVLRQPTRNSVISVPRRRGEALGELRVDCNAP